MNKNTVKLFVALALLPPLLISCSTNVYSSAATKISGSPSDRCMAAAARDTWAIYLRKIVNPKNYSKEEFCRATASANAARRTPFESPRSGTAIIQQNIEINVVTKKSAEDRHMEDVKTCMAATNSRVLQTPPAHEQIEDVLFGLGQIDLAACPSNFKAAFSNYITAWNESYGVAKTFPLLNVGDWYGVVQLQVPSNQNEKLVIDSNKSLVRAWDRVNDIQCENWRVKFVDSNRYVRC